MKIIFLDTETTGLSDYDRLCQIAYKEQGKDMIEALFNPPVEIGVEAMAVHHITPAVVRDKPAFIGSEHHEYLTTLLKKKDVVMVAHNAPFDKKMIEREGIKVANTIDTIKVARYLLKDDRKFKKFSLQSLREQIGITIDDAKAHDAAGDVAVLEALFNWLYDLAMNKAIEKAKINNKPAPTRDQLIKRMIQLTVEPENPDMVRLMFGKHAGKLISEVVQEAPDYLKWLLSSMEGQATDRHNPNLKEAIVYYLTKHGK